ncbi:MAG: hypothetical protein AAFQ82_27935, partial [Myxococcota bacterium]
RELEERLSGPARPGELYVVQLDRAHRRATTDLDGRTYVFRARADGSLERLQSFRSTSQPTTAQRSHDAALANGVPYLSPDLYSVSARRGGTQGQFADGGGYFAFRSGVNVVRDRNDSGRLDRGDGLFTASGILFHDERYGSAGCQLIRDFPAFARLIEQNPSPRFTYLLVRDGDAVRDPRAA